MYFLFADTWITGIGWTLVHSLWLGLVLAVLGGVLMLVTRKATASVRYALLITLMVLFLVAVGVTFALMLSATGLTSYTVSGTVRANGWPGPSFMDTLTGFFNEHSGWIVKIWLLLVVLKLGKLIADWFYVSRLKQQQVYSPEPHWQEKLEQLSNHLGVGKMVRVLESALVKVPVVAGHLKPVILLPLGILANLPASEVEAVLLHELAHVRRNDYLVNLVQRVAELLFFFNPGLLWISSLVRNERENCCDDVAIAASENKVGYVQALVSFREHSLKTPVVVLGFYNKKNQLLDRLQRIVYNRNRTLTGREAGFVSVNVMLLVLLMVFTGETVVRREQGTAHQLTALTQPTNTLQHLPASNPQEGIPVVENIVPSLIGPTPVPSDDAAYKNVYKDYTSEYKDYAGNSDPSQESVNREKERKQSVDSDEGHNQIVNHPNQPEPDRGQTASDRLQAGIERRQAGIDRKAAEHDREVAMADRQRAELDRAQAMRDMEQAEKDRAQAEIDRMQAVKDRIQAERDRMQAIKDREQGERDRGQALKDREQAERDRQQAAKN
ncbi:MAG: hypothetical protein EOO05_19550 [Chitinophagaceae bacterium]|nr:MAG: hypothetical protein EOO05_19550 [Chitinophagaceae bacterium]